MSSDTFLNELGETPVTGNASVTLKVCRTKNLTEKETQKELMIDQEVRSGTVTTMYDSIW